MLTLSYRTSAVEVINASCLKRNKKHNFKTKQDPLFNNEYFTHFMFLLNSPCQQCCALHKPLDTAGAATITMASAEQPWGCHELGTNQKHVGEVGAAHLPADEMPVGIDVQPGWLGRTLPCVLKSLLMCRVAGQINIFFILLMKTAKKRKKGLWLWGQLGITVHLLNNKQTNKQKTEAKS